MTVHFNTTVLQYGGFSLLTIVVSLVMGMFLFARNEFLFMFWVALFWISILVLILSIGGQLTLWITGV